jgi:hypothetical protein
MGPSSRSEKYFRGAFSAELAFLPLSFSYKDEEVSV